MDKSMKILFFLATFFLLSNCSNLVHEKTKYSTITITDLRTPQQFEVPLKYDGWCVSGLSVLENTANDSVKLGAYVHLPPGKTGLIYSQEVPYCESFFFNYTPSKATEGKVVIQWFVRPD